MGHLSDHQFLRLFKGLKYIAIVVELGLKEVLAKYQKYGTLRTYNFILLVEHYL